MTRKKEKTVLAWHFLPWNKRLGYSDNRKVVSGEWLTIPGVLIMCHNGLHASKRILDALGYACLTSEDYNQKWIICRVRLGGRIKDPEYNDKLCARKRKVLWMIDGRTVLEDYAKKCDGSWQKLILNKANSVKNPSSSSLLKLIYEEARKQGLIKRRKDHGKQRRK